MKRFHRWYCRSDRWASALHEKLMPWVLRDVVPGDDVLEIGPGPGLTTDSLRYWAPKLTAIQIDPALADTLRVRMTGTNVDVVTGDATVMPFGDGRSDSEPHDRAWSEDRLSRPGREGPCLNRLDKACEKSRGELGSRSSMQPQTRYAKSGEVHIAYQVVGDGPIDLVIVPGWVSHIELVWQEPQAAAFLRRLGEFSRLILFDKRGTGMSDPLTYAPPVDERMDDIGAVMAAVGSERAALFGYSEGGPLALVFAATHPDQVASVIAYGAFARAMRAPDYPFGYREPIWERFAHRVSSAGSTGELYDVVVPSRHGDEQFREWFARITRQAASPSMMTLYMRANMAIDIRAFLPSIRVPVLVLHRTGDKICRVELGRYLADHIPGARYVELEGSDHWPWFGDTDSVVEEVEEFLTGRRHAAPADRVLATVMFTDIVGSTEKLAQVGDKAWKHLLDQHDAVTCRQVERFRGRTIKHTGDGVLATFDGPARAVQCARTIQEANRAIGLEVRAGLHVGECELRGDDIGGLAVHIAARVAEAAGAGQIMVSSTVKDLVTGSGLEFTDRGLHQLRGVPNEWRLFAVTAP